MCIRDSIYGDGDKDYLHELYHAVEEAHLENNITFMGASNESVSYTHLACRMPIDADEL